MFIIQELQTNAAGTVAALPIVTKDSREEADSVFYQKLASAAISSVACHTVMLYTHEGLVLDRKFYKHGQEASE